MFTAVYVPEIGRRKTKAGVDFFEYDLIADDFASAKNTLLEKSALFLEKVSHFVTGEKGFSHFFARLLAIQITLYLLHP